MDVSFTEKELQQIVDSGKRYYEEFTLKGALYRHCHLCDALDGIIIPKKGKPKPLNHNVGCVFPLIEREVNK